MSESNQVRVAPPDTGEDFGSRVRSDPTFGAFWILRVGFVALPLWMGLDKFMNA